MEELNNCLIAFEISGLQYFSLKLSSTDDTKPKRPSWFRLLYMIFILIVAFFILQAYAKNSGEGLMLSLQNKSIIALVVQNIMVLAYFIVIFASIIHSYNTTNKTKQVFSISSQIKKQSFEAFGKSVDIRALKRKLFKMMRSMAMFFILFHLLMYFMDSGASLLGVLVTALKNFFLVALSLKLVVYVRLVNEHLNFLEEMVQELFPSPPIKIIDNINLHLTVVKSAGFKNEPLKKVRAAREIYNKTFAVTSLINDTVGFSIFLLFVSLILTLTSGGYRIYTASVGGPGGESIFGKKSYDFS